MSDISTVTVNSTTYDIKDAFARPHLVYYVRGTQTASTNLWTGNLPYVDELTRIMKNTDIIVTRAGASTLSEIIALNVPAILIPSPYVPNNHQFKNALDLVNNNAAYLLEEKDLKEDILVKKIDELLKNKDKYYEIKNNLNKLKIDNSASIIYENIKKLDRK